MESLFRKGRKAVRKGKRTEPDSHKGCPGKYALEGEEDFSDVHCGGRARRAEIISIFVETRHIAVDQAELSNETFQVVFLLAVRQA